MLLCCIETQTVRNHINNNNNNYLLCMKILLTVYVVSDIGATNTKYQFDINVDIDRNIYIIYMYIY